MAFITNTPELQPISQLPWANYDPNPPTVEVAADPTPWANYRPNTPSGGSETPLPSPPVETQPEKLKPATEIPKQIGTGAEPSLQPKRGRGRPRKQQ